MQTHKTNNAPIRRPLYALSSSWLILLLLGIISIVQRRQDRRSIGVRYKSNVPIVSAKECDPPSISPSLSGPESSTISTIGGAAIAASTNNRPLRIPRHISSRVPRHRVESSKSTSRISVFAFFDSNGDGIYDVTTSAGIHDTSVSLFPCNGEMMLMTNTTNTAGYCSFDEIDEGQYYISSTPQPWYAFSDVWNGNTSDTVDNNIVDSVINPKTGQTNCFDLMEGEDKTVSLGLMLGSVLSNSDLAPKTVSATFNPSTAPVVTSAPSELAISHPLNIPGTSTPSNAPSLNPTSIEITSTLPSVPPSRYARVATPSHPKSLTLNELTIMGAENKNGHSKANTIIHSTSAIVSIISSSTLIWMIKRTQAGFTTTYNRILLGMAISDIFMSLGLAHFNFTAPRDDSYYVWNASGNQITCNIQGFTAFLGMLSGLFYSCSLNLLSLAVVKYNKPDSYIRSKVEPFLHGVPIAYALIITITLLAKQNINNGGGGDCLAPVYNPPHCIGYEDGETREGFDIPCGRGHDGPVLFYSVGFFATTFLVPLIIGTSLGVIYRTVSKQENNMSRYGESNINRSNSRLVLNRAIAYSISYFLTWSFIIIGVGFDMANGEWPTAIEYLSNIFNPLQGFYNFVIYIFPKVMRAKSRGGDNMTWFQAFEIAFWGGRANQAPGRRRHQPPNRVPNSPVVGEGKFGNKNGTTTENLGQENVVNLGSETKNEDNNNTAAADDNSDGFKTPLTVLNEPSRSPISGSGQL